VLCIDDRSKATLPNVQDRPRPAHLQTLETML
jgi:hypothetical protein